jgi:aryl-alcohol dehydrogenase-like predicted oxidoreductase
MVTEKKMTRREFVRDGAMAAVGIAAGLTAEKSASGADAAGSKILNYNKNMEYRKLGGTGLMVSAVCLGGHWKRIDKMVPGVFKGGGWLSADLNDAGFAKNRYDVVSRCIEKGINYIDACTIEEVRAYSAAIKGRREKMYLGCSWYQNEMRNGNFRTKAALLQTLDKGMKESGLEYVDVWLITMHEQSGRHTDGEVEEMMKALEASKKQGKVRFTGFSSHDRPHIKKLIETYPEIVDVIVTPYTARSKVLPTDSLFEAITKYRVGFFGIKPFAGNSLFKGDSSPGNPNSLEDDRRARLAIRYILCNHAVTAPIPGLINAHQVDNVARAVSERRELDTTEAAELEKATEEMWARLPQDYQWLKDWEYV